MTSPPQRSIAPTVPPYRRRYELRPSCRRRDRPRGCDPAPVAPSHPPPATNSPKPDKMLPLNLPKALTPPPSLFPADAAATSRASRPSSSAAIAPALAAEIKSSGDPALASLVKPGDKCDTCLPPRRRRARHRVLARVRGRRRQVRQRTRVRLRPHAADAKADFERLPDLAPSGEGAPPCPTARTSPCQPQGQRVTSYVPWKTP